MNGGLSSPGTSGETMTRISVSDANTDIYTYARLCVYYGLESNRLSPLRAALSSSEWNRTCVGSAFSGEPDINIECRAPSVKADPRGYIYLYILYGI